jgi:hypothetical protein
MDHTLIKKQLGFKEGFLKTYAMHPDNAGIRQVAFFDLRTH